jgi:hypothetical protein
MPALREPASQCLGLDALSPGKGVLASTSAWAVRPSAASARSAAAQAVFLPAWSQMGEHRCSPSRSEAGCGLIPALQARHESLLLRGLRALQRRSIPVSPGQFNSELRYVRGLHIHARRRLAAAKPFPRTVDGSAFRASPCSVGFA